VNKWQIERVVMFYTNEATSHVKTGRKTGRTHSCVDNYRGHTFLEDKHKTDFAEKVDSIQFNLCLTCHILF